MRGDKDYTLGAWNVDAKSEPYTVDQNSLGVRGLKIEGMVPETDITALTVTVAAPEAEILNTKEQAYVLRQIGMKALEDVLNLTGVQYDNASLVLSELISNAQRHSESGPLRVALVRTTIDEASKDILSVMVVNGAKEKKTEFPDEDFESGDAIIDGLSVHGRGGLIVEALALRNGRFEFDNKRKVAAYALLECERTGYDEIA